MTEFSKIALIRNIYADVGDTVERLYNYLINNAYTVLPELSCHNTLQDTDVRFSTYEQLQDCDLAIVVGGDGTLLNAARELAKHQVPIVGINLGRLGFLVDITPQRMLHSLDEMLHGKYIEEERFLLNVKIEREGEIITEQLACNDVVVKNYYQTRMIEFFTYVDDSFVNHERADGIVIASPTGSTAYALSSGGPILHPSMDAIALVPISPHTLSHRPLVVNANSKISIEIDPQCRTVAQVSFDGQANIELQLNDRIHISRSSTNVKILHPHGYDFFDILRAKLNWGRSPNNDRSNPQ